MESKGDNMTRRVLTSALLLVSSCLFAEAAWAQQAGKIHRIGILNPNSPAIAKKYVDAFRDEMNRLGYTDRNTLIELRYADGRRDRLKDLASQLVQLKVDVIFAPTEPALLAARDVTLTIPIVTVSCDPLEKLVGSLNKPGGNVTGFSCVSSALAGKRLTLLKTVIPKATRVALLYSEPDAYEPDLRNVETSAQKLGVTITRFPVKSPADFEPAFAAMQKTAQHALYIQLSGFANFHRRTLAQLSLKHRVPGIFGFREFPEDGGFMSYGADASDGYRRAAYFVGRILKGARPSDLPAEEPTRFDLVINATTAAAFGITLPAAIQLQADAIIR